MNAPTDITGTDITTTSPPSVPAIPKKMDKWRAFKVLAEWCDELVVLYHETLRTYRDLRQAQREKRPLHLVEIPAVGDIQLSDYYESRLTKCRAWLKEIKRDDYYEDEGDDPDVDFSGLKHKVVAARLALLVGSKPIAGSIEPKAFSRLLLEHVCADDDLDYMALEGACREAEAELKFAPGPSEFLPLLHKHAKLWSTRRSALYGLKRENDQLVALIEQMTRDAVIPKAEHKVKAAERTLESRRESFERSKARAIAAQEAAAKAYEAVVMAMNGMGGVRVNAKAVDDATVALYVARVELAVVKAEAAAAINNNKPEATP